MVTFYEWWTDPEDVSEILQKVGKTLQNGVKNANHVLFNYFRQTFNIKIPCQIKIRIIKEGK
jgi:hypothetical protein